MNLNAIPSKCYERYLFQQAYAKSSIESYLRIKDMFVAWCDSKGYTPELIDYKSCLEYAKVLQLPRNGKTPSKKTVVHQIGALKIFFNYLIEVQLRSDHPMSNINIRGVKRTLNHNLLDFNELEDLFYSCPTLNINPPSCPHVAIRDKVITGLMVYQGLSATSLKALRIEHINLEKGKIYVPGTRKSNARELAISSPQILSLAEYINVSREVLQDSIECHTTAFIPLNGDRFSVIASWLFKKLRRISFKVKNAKQLRASVITHWLELYNIREVQYMAGHRYISSTERYVQDDIESLREVIEALHPIS